MTNKPLSEVEKKMKDIDQREVAEWLEELRENQPNNET